MHTLNAKANASEYLDHYGQAVMFQGHRVVISSFTRDTWVGSATSGSKFTHSKYGILIRTLATGEKQYSCNHGISWHTNINNAKKGQCNHVKLDRSHGIELSVKKVLKSSSVIPTYFVVI